MRKQVVPEAHENLTHGKYNVLFIHTDLVWQCDRLWSWYLMSVAPSSMETQMRHTWEALMRRRDMKDCIEKDLGNFRTGVITQTTSMVASLQVSHKLAHPLNIWPNGPHGLSNVLATPVVRWDLVFLCVLGRKLCGPQFLRSTLIKSWAKAGWYNGSQALVWPLAWRRENGNCCTSLITTNISTDRADGSQETPITRCFVDIKVNKVSFAQRFHALPFFISAAGLVHHFDAGKVPSLPFLSTT